MMADDPLNGRVGAVVAVWSGQGDVAERRSAKTVGVLEPVRHRHVPGIANHRIPLPRSARPELGEHQRMEPVIREQRSRMAAAATGLAVEQFQS